MSEKAEKAQDVILEKINLICNKFGLNNIMAQLYAILYFSEQPLSLNDMVERLKISKGSASVNIRALERYRAVRRVWVKGSRKDYYEAEYDIAKVIIDRIRSMVQSRLLEIDEMLNSSYGILSSVNSNDKEEDEFVRAFEEKLNRLKGLYVQGKSMFELMNSTLSDAAK